eukprot:jgi/Chlat1/6014/Chrsp4S06316
MAAGVVDNEVQGGAAGEAGLTEAEAALYDRQIRVWGVEAQKRMSGARILVAGCYGVVAETAKNIVLAGVGSVAVLDDRRVDSEAVASNLLLLPEHVDSGITCGEACSRSLQELNPMVKVSHVGGSLSDKPPSFYHEYDIVILGRSSPAILTQVEEACRQRNVKFFYVDVRGSAGFTFSDLNSHAYTEPPKSDSNDGPTKHIIEYCTYKAATTVPWQKHHKRLCKLFYAFQILELFEEQNNRRPGQVQSSDLPAVLELRKSVCAEQAVEQARCPDFLLEELVAAGPREMPAVCAIVGGVFGQDVLRTVSGSGAPINNFFFFSVEDGAGLVERIA